jgi:multiple sugar transport system substrate-binding protein
MTNHFNRRTVLALGASAAGLALAPIRALAQSTAINYWHTITSQTVFVGLQKVMEQFAAAHPEIAVSQEAIPNSEFMAKVTTANVAKSVPDTVMVSTERVADLTAMGALVDLTDRINSWPEKANFPEDRWTGITVDGKIYGIPAFTFVDWMYYRKDWFDAAGIAPPTTYAELTEAAKKLTDVGKNRYGFGMRAGQGGGKFIIDVLDAFGAPLVTDGYIGIERAPAIEAMKWYSGLYTTDKVVPPSAPNDGFQQVMQAFQTGQTAMLWHHTGSLVDMSKMLKAGVEFGTAAIPAGPMGRAVRLAYSYNSIMKTDHEDAAFDWIAYWGTADAAITFLKETGYFPASPVIAADERIASDPLYKAAVETLGFGSLPPSFPGLPGWTDNVALPAFQSILIGQTSVEDAVDQMIAGLEAAIA